MKKLSSKQRRRLKRLHAIRLRRRKRSGRDSGARLARAAAKARFYSKYRQCSSPAIEFRPSENREALLCPARLNLTDNYLETISFFVHLQHFLKIRPDSKRIQKYLEFKHLRQVDLGSLLMLAAELDCFIGPYSKTRRVVGESGTADTHLWDLGIAYLFEHFGLLRLLGRRPTASLPEIDSSDLQPVKFRRNVKVETTEAQGLIEDVGRRTGTQDDLKRRHTYEALIEAMTNTKMHAYPPGQFYNFPGKTLSYWWGGAMFDRSNNHTKFVIFDRGIGLPRTIPNQHWMKGFVRIGTETDADLIAAALTQSRSQTGLAHRGKGLPQMAEAVDLRAGSELRILSGRGIVTYRGRDNIEKAELPIDIGGSLIEWTVSE